LEGALELYGQLHEQLKDPDFPEPSLKREYVTDETQSIFQHYLSEYLYLVKERRLQSENPSLYRFCFRTEDATERILKDICNTKFTMRCFDHFGEEKPKENLFKLRWYHLDPDVACPTPESLEGADLIVTLYCLIVWTTKHYAQIVMKILLDETKSKELLEEYSKYWNGFCASAIKMNIQYYKYSDAVNTLYRHHFPTSPCNPEFSILRLMIKIWRSEVYSKLEDTFISSISELLMSVVEERMNQSNADSQPFTNNYSKFLPNTSLSSLLATDSTQASNNFDFGSYLSSSGNNSGLDLTTDNTTGVGMETSNIYGDLLGNTANNNSAQELDLFGSSGCESGSEFMELGDMVALEAALPGSESKSGKSGDLAALFEDLKPNDIDERIAHTAVQSLLDLSLNEATVHYMKHSRVHLEEPYLKFHDFILNDLCNYLKTWADDLNPYEVAEKVDQIANLTNSIVLPMSQNLILKNVYYTLKMVLENHFSQKIREFLEKGDRSPPGNLYHISDSLINSHFGNFATEICMENNITVNKRMIKAFIHHNCSQGTDDLKILIRKYNSSLDTVNEMDRSIEEKNNYIATYNTKLNIPSMEDEVEIYLYSLFSDITPEEIVSLIKEAEEQSR